MYELRNVNNGYFKRLSDPDVSMTHPTNLTRLLMTAANGIDCYFWLRIKSVSSSASVLDCKTYAVSTVENEAERGTKEVTLIAECQLVFVNTEKG